MKSIGNLICQKHHHEGHFKRLSRVTKQILYKSLGRTNLRWSKLDEVLLDVEINMNNRLLTYIEEDIQIFKGKMTKDKEEDLGWQN